MLLQARFPQDVLNPQQKHTQVAEGTDESV